MEVQPLVDAELLFIAHIKGDSDVAAFWDSGEQPSVSTDVPSDLQKGVDDSFPHVRIVRVGGTPVNANRVPDRARLQFETWAATREQSHDLMAAVVRAAHRAIDTPHDAGILYDIREELGPIPNPDPLTDIPRHIWSIVAFIRPAA